MRDGDFPGNQPHTKFMRKWGNVCLAWEILKAWSSCAMAATENSAYCEKGFRILYIWRATRPKRRSAELCPAGRHLSPFQKNYPFFRKMLTGKRDVLQLSTIMPHANFYDQVSREQKRCCANICREGSSASSKSLHLLIEQNGQHIYAATKNGSQIYIDEMNDGDTLAGPE